MKIKTLSRSSKTHNKETPYDLQPLSKNPSPDIHPFEKAREYQRALNAVKLDRVFAKPFIGALEGHIDGVYVVERDFKSLTRLFSGAGDGEIKMWNVSNKKSQVTWNAHRGIVRGITARFEGDKLLSCGSDCKVQCWDIPSLTDFYDNKQTVPESTYIGQSPFNGIDHQRNSNLFATTGGNTVNIWDIERSEPLSDIRYGIDSLGTIKFNPIDTHILCTTAQDRGIYLYDVRSALPIKKLIMEMRTNDISWNPMEAFNFTTANEDHNCYTFDMRKLNIARKIHEDHVSAVLSVDYSPTGTEFATGSYDRTVRIFNEGEGRSREVYHTKRMQKIFSVKFSNDANYVFSGSDDGNVRIWKSHASRNMGITAPRERQKQKYKEKLIERYSSLPEIKRIHKRRHLPKVIKKTQDIKREMKRSQARKENNVRLHSKKGTVPYVPKRKKHIVKLEQ
eukprot:TRINITY_DN11041_c0_g1_i1.p1 TRINITY_DN11041_c0_g1~~TRINITY_DN11041_c0_g1_i1.p1  ORF type:complete len:461 (+),score=89.07 TRINITY_DN11041_c0_g1_i1:35-1384(+)